jgi:hypothetical protein
MPAAPPPRPQLHLVPPPPERAQPPLHLVPPLEPTPRPVLAAPGAARVARPVLLVAPPPAITPPLAPLARPALGAPPRAPSSPPVLVTRPAGTPRPPHRLHLVAPPRPSRRLRLVDGLHSESGQASVELVALLPLVVAILALVYQALLAGQAVWEVRVASRAAARANAFGGDAEDAARGHLSAKLERGLRVHASDDGDVEVSVRIPQVLPAVNVGRASSTSHFRPQNG